MMNNTIILLNNGFGRIELLSKALRSRGRHVTVIAQRSCRLSVETFDDVVFCDDIYDVNELSRLVQDIKSKTCIESIINNSAALTFVHYGLLKSFGDPFGYSNWLLNAHVKAECRRILFQKGISKVGYHIIHDTDELERLHHCINYPSVIKPIVGQSSEGVFKVSNYHELSMRYEQIKSGKIKGVNAANKGNLNDIVLNGYAYNIANDVMVEEYICGDEFTVDGYIEGNDIVIVAIHQKYFGIEDNGFRDRFYVTPPRTLSDKERIEIDGLIRSTCKALDMSRSLFHIEIRQDVDGFKIIEVNPRLGGGTIQENIALATGVSLIDVYANILCGMPVAAVVRNSSKVIFDFGLTIPKSGRVIKIEGVDELRSMKEVSNIQLNIKQGDIINDVMGERFVLFCNGAANSHDEAFELFNKVNNTIKLEIV